MAKGGGCCWLPPAELSWVSLRHVLGRSEADLIAWFNLPTFIAFKLNICLDVMSHYQVVLVSVGWSIMILRELTERHVL